jgi:putative transposase
MLSQTEWLALCQRLQLSPQAQQIVEEIRSSPPSRRVRSAAGNVSVRYPSRKMGMVIQAESHRNELAGVYEKEHDPETLEYYDQPPPIKLTYLSKSERPVGIWHTPDYFVIRRDALGWEEWKMEEALVRLAEDMPHRYQHGAEGGWRCPPGEDHARPLGFFYRVRSSAEINWVFQRNLLFLEDYLRTDCPAVAPVLAQALVARVTAQPGLPLQRLLQEATRMVEEATPDAIYTLIATERLYVDLKRVPLADPERVPVFCDEMAARRAGPDVPSVSPASLDSGGTVEVAPNVAVDWDGQRWLIANVGLTQITLLADNGQALELSHATLAALVQQNQIKQWRASTAVGLPPAALALLAQASPTDLREANRRYAIIAPRLAGQPLTNHTASPRTIRLWLADWREAEQAYGCGYVGLLPRRRKSGNRTRRLPARTVEAIENFIANDYETLKQKPRLEVFGALLRACEAQGIAAPSYKTFVKAIANRPREEQTLKRQGRRAAYQEAPFYHELTLTTPRHGDRPFEIAHIDHTELDVELVCSRTGRNLGRPWATFLSDAFSRRLLAVYLTFDPPSYRACMMTLRECVRRHARLPQTIVVDGGREFGSVYFETLLARYECGKKTRPSAEPRFGSVCERLFGAANTQFVHNLLGNTQIMLNVRQVTQSVNPQNLACWTLGGLYQRLCEWAYEVHDTLDHPALGQSPREAFNAGLAIGGLRPHRLIAYDESLRMLTLPTTRKGTAKVTPQLGIKINHIRYWADAFLNIEVENRQLPVRFDPFDAGTAYAFIKDRWVKCLSEHYAEFAGHSERELMLATAELNRRQQRQAQQLAITARKLADFLASVEADELLLQQRLRDAEARDIVGKINTGGTPPPPEPSRPMTDTEPVPDVPAQTEPQVETLEVYEDY